MVLLQQQHRDPAWNRSLGAYWRSLPPRGRVYTKEAFTDAHLRLLQDARLVRGDPNPMPTLKLAGARRSPAARTARACRRARPPSRLCSARGRRRTMRDCTAPGRARCTRDCGRRWPARASRCRTLCTRQPWCGARGAARRDSPPAVTNSMSSPA